MDDDVGWGEPVQGDCLFDPTNDVITSSACVISEVVVQAYIGHLARLEQYDSLFRPPSTYPALRSKALIIEVNFHRTTSLGVT